MIDRLAVIAMGHSDSGKSYTWNSLFCMPPRRYMRSGHHCLELRANQFVDVLLIIRAPQEYGENAFWNMLKGSDCPIVLLSIRYNRPQSSNREYDIETILDYLILNKFQLYVQWINPGKKSSKTTPDMDSRGIGDKVRRSGGDFHVRDGKKNADSRVQEIRDFIYEWSLARNLIVT